MSYYCRGMWNGQLISEAYRIKWRLFYLFKTHELLYYLRLRRGQCLLLVAPGYAAGIWLRQVCLKEVLNIQPSIHLSLLLQDIVDFGAGVNVKLFSFIRSIERWSTCLIINVFGTQVSSFRTEPIIYIYIYIYIYVRGAFNKFSGFFWTSI